MTPDLLVAIAGVLIAIAAVIIASMAIRRADTNASSANLVPLYESFRGAWARYLAAANEDEKKFELAELVNLFELAAVIHGEGSLKGEGKELIEAYIWDCLDLFYGNGEIRRGIAEMRHSENTFKNLVKFLIYMEAKGRTHPAKATLEAAISPNPEIAYSPTFPQARP